MSELSAVSRTAIGVAAARAVESARPDRLFNDAYADGFVARLAGDPTAPERIAAGIRPALTLHIVLRTRFYDDHLAAAGMTQVVLLGAGLDTRAYRLDWPSGTTVYELDLPALLAVKERLLPEPPAGCRRVVLPVDLLGDWVGELRAAGFQPAVPTAWLAEGLLVYFDREQATHVLTGALSVSALGSSFACELPVAADGAAVQDMGERSLTDMWKGGLGADLAPWLAEHGWAVSVSTLAELAAQHGRDGGEGARGALLRATY